MAAPSADPEPQPPPPSRGAPPADLAATGDAAGPGDLLAQALARVSERRGGAGGSVAIAARALHGRGRLVVLGAIASVVLAVAVAPVLSRDRGDAAREDAATARVVDELLPRATAPSGTAGGGGATTTGRGERMLVHAAGAVRAPGLYRLPAGARVDDLVHAAGGLADDGDVDRLNLAAPLSDGTRVYVPRRGEAAPPVVVGAAGGSGAGVAGGPGDTQPPSIVDLNTATIEQLDTLPGIGPSTAQAIVAWRTEHGRFTTVDDLEQVRGIGPARLDQLRPLVRVG